MNRYKILALTCLFPLLYVAVSVATFRHSAFGFASLEGGSFWWGALSALAVDAGMILSAFSLRNSRNFWLIAGLVISASASTYTQLLYAVSEAATVTVADGASWLADYATIIVNVRVLLLPALLPTLSVVYAFASKLDNGAKTEGLDARVNAILARNLGKKETAAAIWRLSRNGHGDFTVSQVAQWVGCSPRTAQSAKPEAARRGDGVG